MNPPLSLSHSLVIPLKKSLAISSLSPLSSGPFPSSPKNAPYSLSNRHAPFVSATRSSPAASISVQLCLLFAQLCLPFFKQLTHQLLLFLLSIPPRAAHTLTVLPSPSIFFACPRTAPSQGGQKNNKK